MSIPVESHFLYSIREQASLTWRSMVCELIDNSFGAKAEAVRLCWPGGKVFSISDDGHGTNDLTRMLTLGAKRDRDSSDLGYYGVGAKLALIWLWGESTVKSSTKEALHEVSVCWDDVASDRSPYPSASSVLTSESLPKTGTLIHCKSDRRYPKFEDLIESIANTYTPGLELGKKISVQVLRGPLVALKPREWPRTDKEIVDTITAAGRQVTIRMGIVSEGVKNPYNKGFSFERAFRVIKESTLGANGFSVSRLAARITLGEDWKLSTNKDDFTEYQEELAEAIYDRCSDLMEEASEQAISIEDSRFNRELAQLVQSGTGKRKEKRPGSGGEVGAVEPKNSGRKRTNATNSSDEPGSVNGSANKSQRTGFTIDSYEAESPTFGYYDSDGNRVRLNVANKWLGEMHKNREQNTLLCVIYGILADHSRRDHTQKNPLFKDQIDQDFCTNWGRSVESVAEGKQETCHA